ncbi:MAG: nitroreductase family protein [Candidatus Bathyarchaeota archaeon]|nr:nitroreductase family protein [Candidatus Bathyarchaeota archaeon]
MNVTDAIKIRRAYRSLDPTEITTDLIHDLAYHASLSASCGNNQPWRFVFVYDKEQLNKLYTLLPKGNKWMEQSSMIIAVFSRQGDDCIVKDRVYNLFDVGMGTAFLILRATELGLVAHPVAGYDQEGVKQLLNIPIENQVITLINVGKHSAAISPLLSEKQIVTEKERPLRKIFEEYAYMNRYSSN